MTDRKATGVKIDWRLGEDINNLIHEIITSYEKEVPKNVSKAEESLFLNKELFPIIFLKHTTEKYYWEFKVKIKNKMSSMLVKMKSV